MKPMRSTLVTAVLAASVAAVGTVGELPAQGPDAEVDRLDRDIERIREATEEFHDLSAAHDAGYPTRVPPCVDNPPEGGMGHHYVHPELMDDRLDVERPEILVYAPTEEGELKLAGVEYAVPYSAWDRDEAPRILGRDLEPSDHLQLWYLHVWVWEENSNGLFADWNPAVVCDEDVGRGEAGGGPAGRETSHALNVNAQEEPSMGTTLEASFEITGWEETDLVDGDVRVYRADVTKSFTGDIEGSSESWLVMTATPSGPAAYVGLEVLEVSIGERDGTFVLKHDAVAIGEAQETDWTIVPGSGTGDFADIAGTAEIERHDDGSHTLTLTLE